MINTHNRNTDKYLEILFPYAYNILGSTEDAKDAIQDVLVKYFSGEIKEITDEKNYLIRSVINRAINLKSRQKRILRYDEVWLPEPVATDDAPDRNLYLNDVLSYSLLVLMERLNAKERAVFILKETFDYTHSEIADILNVNEENSRKLLSRAKANLFKPAQKRSENQTAHERAVVLKFMEAIRQGDTKQLEGAMAADIQFYADGGGKAPVLAFSGEGSATVANLIMTAYTKFMGSAKIVYTRINHQPALLSYMSDRLTSCQVFDVHPHTGAVMQISAILDPDKLRSLDQQIVSNTGHER